MNAAMPVRLYPVVLAIFLQFAPCVASAQAKGNFLQSNEGTVTEDVTRLLQDFMAAVPRSDKKVFDSFFADDVIYTRSAGVTVNKAGIMKNIGVRAASEPAATFEADDITVHPYTDMAVVNFRLVMHNENNGKPETAYYRNTGTFLKRSGKWQVVAWQSTKVPAEDAKR